MPNLQTAAIFLAATLLPSHVHGHGYMNTPRSRNWVAAQDGLWWTTDETIPAKEVEPQSANIRGHVCGKIQSRDYNYPKNVAGAPLPAKPQACYELNSVIDVAVTLTGESSRYGIVCNSFDVLYCNCPALTFNQSLHLQKPIIAHHKGHFEFWACPINEGEVPTQACFDANPLTFVSDAKTGAQLHPSYPERAYLAPSVLELEYKFQLPIGMVGDFVLLQWHYVTANSCKPPGYDDLDNPNTFGHHQDACVPEGTADNAEQVSYIYMRI